MSKARQIGRAIAAGSAALALAAAGGPAAAAAEAAPAAAPYDGSPDRAAPRRSGALASLLAVSGRAGVLADVPVPTVPYAATEPAFALPSPLPAPLRQIIVNLADADPGERALAANRAINTYIYREDAPQGAPDYWMSPAEFLVAGGGDCEDFALIKRAMLRVLGFREDDIGIVVVRNRRDGRAHAATLAVVNRGVAVLDLHHDRLRPWSDFQRDWVPVLALVDGRAVLFQQMGPLITLDTDSVALGGVFAAQGLGVKGGAGRDR